MLLPTMGNGGGQRWPHLILSLHGWPVTPKFFKSFQYTNWVHVIESRGRRWRKKRGTDKHEGEMSSSFFVSSRHRSFPTFSFLSSFSFLPFVSFSFVLQPTSFLYCEMIITTHWMGLKNNQAEDPLLYARNICSDHTHFISNAHCSTLLSKCTGSRRTMPSWSRFVVQWVGPPRRLMCGHLTFDA